MKRVYLVRHGLTLANEQEIIQDAQDPLAARGIEQAKSLAERLSKVPFDTLVSSDLPRAMDTANIIAQKTKHTVESSPLLREVPFPSELFGVLYHGPKVEAYFAEQRAHASDPHYRFGDEETHQELKARAKAAADYLASREGDVVAVSHGLFIRKMFFEIVFGGALSIEQEQHAVARMLTNNTGITVFEHKNDRWQLLTWNDHAHLG